MFTALVAVAITINILIMAIALAFNGVWQPIVVLGIVALGALIMATLEGIKTDF